MDNTDTLENKVTSRVTTDIEIEQEIDTDIDTELEGEGDIETEGELDSASDTQQSAPTQAVPNCFATVYSTEANPYWTGYACGRVVLPQTLVQSSGNSATCNTQTPTPTYGRDLSDGSTPPQSSYADSSPLLGEGFAVRQIFVVRQVLLFFC